MIGELNEEDKEGTHKEMGIYIRRVTNSTSTVSVRQLDLRCCWFAVVSGAEKRRGLQLHSVGPSHPLLRPHGHLQNQSIGSSKGKGGAVREGIYSQEDTDERDESCLESSPLPTLYISAGDVKPKQRHTQCHQHRVLGST